MNRNTNIRGFTLLEVVVTLALLSISVLGFSQGQRSTMNLTLRAETRLQAVELAQLKMTEVELDLRQKGFGSFLEDEKGGFKDEKLGKKFKWTRKFERVEAGCFLPDQSDAKKGAEAQTGGILQVIKPLLETSTRKIKVTVEWQESGKLKQVSLAQLYVDYKSLPAGP